MSLARARDGRTAVAAGLEFWKNSKPQAPQQKLVEAGRKSAGRYCVPHLGQNRYCTHENAFRIRPSLRNDDGTASQNVCEAARQGNRQQLSHVLIDEAIHFRDT